MMIHQFFPFTSQNNMFGIDCAIDRQNTVEMVDLMLKQFRQTAVRRPCFPLPGFILKTNRNRCGAFHFHKNVGKRKAIIPQRHHLPGSFCNRRIDDGNRFIEIKKQNSQRTADLRSGNSPAESLPAAKVSKRVAQIVNC